MPVDFVGGHFCNILQYSCIVLNKNGVGGFYE